jgi:hypothetical protein
MHTYYETVFYRARQDRFGNGEIVRVSDGASVFFQGEDARAFDESLGDLEARFPHNIGSPEFESAFNELCSEYEPVLNFEPWQEVHAKA